MNIESSAEGGSRVGMMQNVKLLVLKMALGQSELQEEAIAKLLASSEIIQDPDLGLNIDLRA
jgi:hypothetical protein